MKYRMKKYRMKADHSVVIESSTALDDILYFEPVPEEKPAEKSIEDQLDGFASDDRPTHRFAPHFQEFLRQCSAEIRRLKEDLKRVASMGATSADDFFKERDKAEALAKERDKLKAENDSKTKTIHYLHCLNEDACNILKEVNDGQLGLTPTLAWMAIEEIKRLKAENESLTQRLNEASSQRGGLVRTNCMFRLHPIWIEGSRDLAEKFNAYWKTPVLFDPSPNVAPKKLVPGDEPPKPRCENCRFRGTVEMPDGQFMCRRYPPSFQSDDDSCYGPSICPDDWCGEFQAKQDK